MTRKLRKTPPWLRSVLLALAAAALAAAGLAVYMSVPGGAPAVSTADAARDRAYKAFARRLDGYRACRADADCARVKPDCTCTAVAKDRLADFSADFRKTAAEAGLASCVDWPEPSCEDATSAPVCVQGACRVHVTIEDAAWDQ